MSRVCQTVHESTLTTDRGPTDIVPTPTTTIMSPRATTEFLLESPAFKEGGKIPATYTCEGTDTSPELAIGGVPDDAASLALVVDDPDAPGGTFVHWLLWNLPPSTIRLPRGVRQGPAVAALDGARQGTNGFNTVGYRGPCPPRGDGPHNYRFTLYACDTELDVPAGVKSPKLMAAIEASEIEHTRLTGTYERV
ncbi:YbhB/YbcL family Raf kinase inhibitor-like protein [Haloarchaeobius sp. DFWS5]|uniref:YbhB/YbcL family Raf kinase inhibitor-like protein n=1 Tax=Haloarchaeobius sp. DFWS5 TaxID=3446114 RepID=UPI003EBFA3FD